MSAQRTRRPSRFIGIELKQVGLSLSDRPVLRGVNWTIRPGERWVLMGPNGAGKTLLLKLIAGDVWPTPPKGSRRYLYGSVSHRDPVEVKEEIAYLGAERQDRYEHYRWNHPVEAIIGTGLYRTDIPLDPLTAVDRGRVMSLLRRFKIEALAGRRFLTLSYGERRLVLLARALASRPKLLLLDELFNGLDAENHARVQHCLKILSRSSLPWILATHRDRDIPAQATHLCRLRAGRIWSRRRLRRSTVDTAATRRAASDRQVRRHGSSAARSATAKSQPPVLKVHRATIWREGAAVLRNVSMTIRRGDCWVVHGANGSGKSSLLQLLYGDLGAAQGGRVWRAGIESGVPLELFKRHVGLIAPELQALHPRYLQVAEVVASGGHASIGLNEGLPATQHRHIHRALRRVGAGHLQHRLVRTLSYGQLRRVLFARALMHEPDILLLDEPYAGIDATTRDSLRALVERASAAGVTVVMATHHRDEWPPTVDHELELRQSQVIYCGPARS
jgi:molybdate transport system ATP-binding protein